MAYEYTYSLATDFGGILHEDILAAEIEAAALGQTLDNAGRDGDVVHIVFTAQLSQPDKTSLDGGLTQTEESPPLAGSILFDHPVYVPPETDNEVVTHPTTNPGVNDDASEGYSAGDRWINISSGAEFVCVDATDGAAVWTEITKQGDVTSSSAITDEAVVVGDGGAKGVQSTPVTVDPATGKVVIPSANNVVGLEIGTGSYPFQVGLDSGGSAFLQRGGGAGTLKWMPNATNPQWLVGDGTTDTGYFYIDTDSLTQGARAIRINTLAGAGLDAPVYVGPGGYRPWIDANTPLGESAKRFQRGYINAIVGGVDVFNSAQTLDDATYVVAQDGTYTLTLPTAEEGWAYVIERQGSTGTVTLAPGSGDTISGGGSVALDSNATYLIYAEDATDWRLVACGGSKRDTTYATTVSSWTLSGGRYYADVVHNLGTKDVLVEVYTTDNDETVGVHTVDRTDTSTVRIWVKVEENVRVLVTTGGLSIGSTGLDPNAFHSDISGEIVAVALKTTPIDVDTLLIEDSQAASAKKSVQLIDLPSNSGSEGHTWDFSTTTTDSDPGAGVFRLNNATQGSATYLYVDDLSKSGIDFSDVLLRLKNGDRLYVQESAAYARNHLFRIEGTPEAGSGYVRVPVAVLSSGSDLRDGKPVTFVMATASGQILYDAVVASTGGDYTSVAAAFAGGATSVWVSPGFYVETADIVVPSYGSLVSSGAVIHFMGGAYSVVVDGSGGTKETAGTISVTNGDATVTGSGTTFTNLSAGNYIQVGDAYSPIDSITSDTSLELSKTWKGNTQTGLSYQAMAMASGVFFEGIVIAGAQSAALLARAVIGLNMRALSIHSNGGDGIQIVDCYGVSVTACSCTGNGGNGYVITSSNEVSISGSCHGDSNTGNGMVVDGVSEGVFVSNSSLTNNGGDGLTIEDTTHGVTISNSECNYNNGDGLNADPTTATVLVSNCVFEHNGAWGLDWDGPYNVISNCVMEDNDSGGIQGGDNGSIISCHVAGNGGIGINLGGSDNGNTCSGCLVHDNSSAGIYSNAADNVYFGNYVYDNGGIGIHLDTSSSANKLTSNRVTGNTGGNIVDAGTGNLVLDDAFHPTVSGQINALSAKLTPVGADILVLEDSAASYAKKKVAVSSFSSVFGQDYQRQESLGTSSTTGEDQTKVTLTTGAITGTYRIGWGCALLTNNKTCEANLYNLTDATELMNQGAKPTDDGGQAEFAGGVVHLTFSGSAKTIQLRYGNIPTKSDDITVKNAWIEIWRVS